MSNIYLILSEVLSFLSVPIVSGVSLLWFFIALICISVVLRFI